MCLRRHPETIKSAAQTLPPFFHPFHRTPWILRAAFRLDSSCPLRATYTYMATVTSRTGTTARWLFSAHYLPNPGSTTTTTATSFRVEESRLLVVVSLTCLWISQPKGSAIVSCARVALGDQLFQGHTHWPRACPRALLSQFTVGSIQVSSVHACVRVCVCACVCVCVMCQCQPPHLLNCCKCTL